ncbi:hypothetical protein SAMN05192551_1209 [Tindallia magadiensis]|uniref:Uncharacterized protein n=1 Tax=Tindallia magadiensis TaxID=69895 RepID=A0A1I3I2I2_9FIRM|nr:hypothetical protein SAMN05192551_1209 [Tindallia magadiensis]
MYYHALLQVDKEDIVETDYDNLNVSVDELITLFYKKIQFILRDILLIQRM